MMHNIIIHVAMYIVMAANIHAYIILVATNNEHKTWLYLVITNCM